MKLIRYLEARLLERSFWGDIALSATAAALLPKPWNYVFMALCVIKSLIPDAPKVTPPA